MIRPNRDRFGNWLPDVAQARREASKAARKAARPVQLFAYKVEARDAKRQQLRGFKMALAGQRLARRYDDEVSRNTLNGKLVGQISPHLVRAQTADLARWQNIPGGNAARRERKRVVAEFQSITGRVLTFRRFRRMCRLVREAA